MSLFYSPSHYQQSFSLCYCAHYCASNFSLVLLTCSPKLSLLSKLTPSSLTLDLTGFGELLIVRRGSNLGSLLHVVNTVALDFSADNLSFPDSSQPCKVFGYEVIISRNFSTSG